MKTLDVIRVEEIWVDCILGLQPRERTATQPVRLDFSLHLDTRPALAGAGLAGTYDYRRLVDDARFLLEAGRFWLIEAAAEAICRRALAPPTPDAPHGRVDEVVVRLTKPSALGGHGRPSLEIRRTLLEQKPAAIAPVEFGRVETLFAAEERTVRRLHLLPGRSAPAEDEERPIGPGLRRVDGRWENPTDGEQTLLRVTRPDD